MDTSGAIQFIASLAEIVIALVALLIATRKKKTYGWFIALAFGLLVVFNFARIFALGVPPAGDAMIFLIAGLSMVCAVWMVWTER